MFASVAAYRQTRTSFSADTAQVLSTLSTGWEAELRWAPIQSPELTAGGTWQTTRYTPVRPATISVNPTFFGLRTTTTVADCRRRSLGEPQYAERSGYPDMVLNTNGTFYFTKEVALQPVGVPTRRKCRRDASRTSRYPMLCSSGAAVVYDTPSLAFRRLGEQPDQRAVLHAELT